MIINKQGFAIISKKKSAKNISNFMTSQINHNTRSVQKHDTEEVCKIKSIGYTFNKNVIFENLSHTYLRFLFYAKIKIMSMCKNH